MIKNVKSRDSLFITGDFNTNAGTVLEKEGQIAMGIIYSSWKNHSHLNLQILFLNTSNVIDQIGNHQSRLVKLKTYPDRLYASK